MKNYFIDKLKRSMINIEKLQNGIIEAAEKMDIDNLLKWPKVLREEKERHKELIRDLCTYCSVDEVIEVSNLNLVDEYTIERFYEDYSKGITIEERTKLIEKFGYNFRNAKVK